MKDLKRNNTNIHSKKTFHLPFPAIISLLVYVYSTLGSGTRPLESLPSSSPQEQSVSKQIMVSTVSKNGSSKGNWGRSVRSARSGVSPSTMGHRTGGIRPDRRGAWLYNCTALQSLLAYPPPPQVKRVGRQQFI